jgi:glycerol uptake facilitator-like aquaporin
MYNSAIVEFLGTALIVGAYAFTQSSALFIAATAIAVALSSKSHFNPAITGWALASGKIGMQKAISYFIAQFGAGLLVYMMNSIIAV